MNDNSASSHSTSKTIDYCDDDVESVVMVIQIYLMVERSILHPLCVKSK